MISLDLDLFTCYLKVDHGRIQLIACHTVIVAKVILAQIAYGQAHGGLKAVAEQFIKGLWIGSITVLTRLDMIQCDTYHLDRESCHRRRAPSSVWPPGRPPPGIPVLRYSGTPHRSFAGTQIS